LTLAIGEGKFVLAGPRSDLNGQLQEGMIPLSPPLELNNLPLEARRCARPRLSMIAASKALR
jgi:hypothetical protein